MTIAVEAVDTRGNRETTATQIWVALPPTVDTFAPSAGPTTGMTNIYVVGTNFVGLDNATQVLIGGLPVDPLTVDDAQHMHGLIPPHDPGVFLVTVNTGGASVMPGSFGYVAGPDVRAVYPLSGPAMGGTPIEIAGAHFRLGATRILFGDSPFAPELLCPSFVSEHLIKGITPPGAGAVPVVASDPIGGEGAELGAFQYVDSNGDDGGAADGNADAGDAGPPPLVCPPPDDGGTP
jgi:hypothetical protein